MNVINKKNDYTAENVSTNINDKIKKQAQKWRERFNDGLARLGFKKQEEFAKAFKEKYHTQCSQRNVSRWSRVGDKEMIKGTAKTIGFPSYRNMIMIADFLGVDVAYLTGEIDAGTVDCQKVSNYIGLAPNAVMVLKEMANTNDQFNSLIRLSITQKNQDILNKLFVQEEFQYFVDSLCELDEAYNRSSESEKIWEQLESKYGKAVIDQAYCLYTGSTDLEHEDTSEYSETIKNAYVDVSQAIDRIAELQNRQKEELSIKKYNLFESFIAMISNMYPQNN